MSLRLGPGSAAFCIAGPFLPAAGELKTTPTPHSVQKLSEIGLSRTCSGRAAGRSRDDRAGQAKKKPDLAVFRNVAWMRDLGLWDRSPALTIPSIVCIPGAGTK